MDNEELRVLAEEGLKRAAFAPEGNTFSLGIWSRDNLPKLAQAVLDLTKPKDDSDQATSEVSND